ncbi:TRAP transporter small permease [Methylomonas rivi]|uniref:TRAP transporter small permease protein n=1 Tax=Methylomonas rivi TaxID=2952226 RepID=A0ABT1U8Y9_9GAMM|nr:TRAP transporter small permease [Methylomonas sp. WSC-6]MCQ8129859.1 TRAP transporter small permease [Methylomonas sp. WSC-6]
MSLPSKLHRFLLKAETLLLVTLLLSLVVIAVTQVVMRNLAGGGLLWADAYTRISVLWLAMLGAMLGSRRQSHLAIDAFVRFLPARWKNRMARINNGLTGLICFTAAWFSGDFLAQEYRYADLAFANIPNWWCEAIIPLAFFVIALRYSVAAFSPENQTNLDT